MILNKINEYAKDNKKIVQTKIYCTNLVYALWFSY